MLHITTAAEEHLPTYVLGLCGRGDKRRNSYSWGWGRLLGLLLQLIEVVSVDNIHLEQFLLLATQQSLHNITISQYPSINMCSIAVEPSTYGHYGGKSQNG